MKSNSRFGKDTQLNKNSLEEDIRLLASDIAIKIAIYWHSGDNTQNKSFLHFREPPFFA